MTNDRRPAGQQAGTSRLPVNNSPVKTGPVNIPRHSNGRMTQVSPPTHLIFTDRSAVANRGSTKPTPVITDKALFFTEPDDFILVKEAASLLRKKENAIYNMIRDGRLSSVKVGGTRYIYKPDLMNQIHASFE